MSTASALYQELLLAHATHPHNRGPLLDATHRGHRDNPFCGDELTVALVLTDRLTAVHFEGTGCAVSIASASMMTTALAGKTVPEAAALAARLFQLVSTGADDPGLGDLAALAAVSRFPVRVQCARLPWEALLAALGLPA
jgi:nitrogen fixation NifU-like protein